MNYNLTHCLKTGKELHFWILYQIQSSLAKIIHIG